MDSDLLISSRFIDEHPLDAARILERLPIEDTAAFLKEVSPRAAAAVMGRMDSMTAARYLEWMGTKQAAGILANLRLEIASLLLRRSDERTKEAKELTGDARRQALGKLRTEQADWQDKYLRENMTPEEYHAFKNYISAFGYHFSGSAKFFARAGDAFARAVYNKED